MGNLFLPNKPFFLYLAHNMPHLPVYHAAKSTHLEGKKGGALGAVLYDMDAGLKEIWDKVNESGMGDNTIFVFSSDNGPWIEYPERMGDDSVTIRSHVGSAGAFRGSKAQSYEGGTRVPFIVHWRGKIPRDTKIDLPISNIDIFPTIAKWSGTAIPEDLILDGEDISLLLEGQISDFDNRRKPIFIVNYGNIEAVKIGKWKYRKVAELDVVEELFDLDEDPYERVNLITLYPEIHKQMKVVFDSFDAY